VFTMFEEQTNGRVPNNPVTPKAIVPS
jgi:hypothetical protein